MKSYFLRFGFGDPRPFTGLAPSLIIFKTNTGTDIVGPTISEVGTTTGLYTFSWGTTTSMVFLADAMTTSPGTQGRYVIGDLDPADRADEYGTTMIAIGTTIQATIPSGITLTALGNTLVAIGTTNIALGTTNVALGTTNVAIGTTTQAIATTILAQGLSITVTVAGIGSTASSFGDSVTDPVDLFGYMKRIQELVEGNEIYLKPSGSLTMFSRGGTVTLRQKTITNSVSTVVKA